MNPYLAKLHSLNFAKAAPRATDKTGKTTSEASCVGFVGVQGCLASKNDLCSTQPDGRAHSERLSTQSTEDKRAAVIECDGGAPRVWAEALAGLDPACPPCDIPPMRWLRFVDDCGRFLDEGWATHAERLGWAPLELFGCDRTKPLARISRAGLLWLVDGRKLLALSADAAAIANASGSYLTFRRRILESGGVLTWELQLDAS